MTRMNKHRWRGKRGDADSWKSFKPQKKGQVQGAHFLN